MERPEFKHRPGYYLTLVHGIPKYVKESRGNKLRHLNKIQVEFKDIFNLSNPKYKKIDMEFISANENNETNHPLYEDNRELYKIVKNKILKSYES